MGDTTSKKLSDIEIAKKLPASTQAPDDPLDYLTPGYPRLAGYMASRPETAIFRRFSELHAKTLLYVQADLYRLEKELSDSERNDARGAGNRPKYCVDYDCLASSHRDTDTRQLKLVNEITYKLKDYDTALIQASRVFQLKAPDKFDLGGLQRWLGRQADSGSYLQGNDAYTWGTQESPRLAQSDLISLKPRIKEDWFSRWVAKKGVHLMKYDLGRWLKCQCCFRPRKHCSQRRYYDTTVLKWTFRATGIFVGLLPVASIIVLLHFNKHRWIQIGFIAAFNVIMSIALMVLADAKRTDCFAVTAAFTAVQVVFLGVDGQCSNN